MGETSAVSLFSEAFEADWDFTDVLLGLAFKEDLLASGLTEAVDFTEDLLASGLTEAVDFTEDLLAEGLTEAVDFTEDLLAEGLTEALDFMEDLLAVDLTEAMDFMEDLLVETLMEDLLAVDFTEDSLVLLGTWAGESWLRLMSASFNSFVSVSETTFKIIVNNVTSIIIIIPRTAKVNAMHNYYNIQHVALQ